LIQLLRGGERDRLMALADHDRLFEGAMFHLDDARRRQRADSLQILAQFGSERCIEGIGRMMGADQDEELRLAAASALAKLGALPGPRETVNRLRLMDEPVTRVHLALFRSLATLHARELRVVLKDKLPGSLRAAIVDALGWSGDAAVLKDLAKAAGDPDPEVRCAALRAANQLGHPDAARWIVPRLGDPDVNVRIQAAKSCAKLRSYRAVPALRQLALDPSWWVRWRANEALRSLVRTKAEAIAK